MSLLKKSLTDNYANFKGRSSKKEAISFFLFNIAFFFTLGFLAVFFASLKNDALVISLSVFQMLANLLLYIPSLSLGIRRLHDINKSGWWLLISLTVIGLIPLFYWSYFKDGDPHDNDYGAPPLE